MPLPKKVQDLMGPLNLIPHPEGGFFAETFRSGSEPMSTMGQTGLDCEKPDVNLVVANGRAKNRPDGDERRNALTSIYWVPTDKSPKLLLAVNRSDHVHYYHGGKPFTYSLFDPATEEFSTITLGPELHKGHSLQVCVKGGVWKCGLMEDIERAKCRSDDDYDYCLLGEAVAPGFDFHDFKWVTEEELSKTIKDEKVQEHFRGFLHDNATELLAENKTVSASAEFYEDGDERKERVQERA